jgi:hypothetical protein
VIEWNPKNLSTDELVKLSNDFWDLAKKAQEEGDSQAMNRNVHISKALFREAQRLRLASCNHCSAIVENMRYL